MSVVICSTRGFSVQVRRISLMHKSTISRDRSVTLGDQSGNVCVFFYFLRTNFFGYATLGNEVGGSVNTNSICLTYENRFSSSVCSFYRKSRDSIRTQRKQEKSNKARVRTKLKKKKFGERNKWKNTFIKEHLIQNNQ